MLLKQEKDRQAQKPSDSVNEPIPPPRTGKWESVRPKPVPRKSVNEYEDLILPPPPQFRDGNKPIPKPRTDRPLQMQNARRPPKPHRPPIKEHEALKGHTKSYLIRIKDNLNQLKHFTKTKELVELHLKELLKTMKVFKFIETLEVTFEKETIN